MNEKIAKETADHARHNMTSAQLQTAIEQAKQNASIAEEQATHHKSVLAGLKTVAKERGIKL